MFIQDFFSLKFVNMIYDNMIYDSHNNLYKGNLIEYISIDFSETNTHM